MVDNCLKYHKLGSKTLLWGISGGLTHAGQKENAHTMIPPVSAMWGEPQSPVDLKQQTTGV